MRKATEQRVVARGGTVRRRGRGITKQHRDAHEIVRDRRDVGLGAFREVHLDVRAPRAHRVVTAKAVARGATRGGAPRLVPVSRHWEGRCAYGLGGSLSMLCFLHSYR